ncbi:hypothetical protein WJX73_001355 [Symbiochloris irregularis]|uniref:RRM domain-containing protein n=1 Tax=Symbiochloris irregularis TaxID=706552 RepID=A0AAW1P6B5_9CHLO
MTAAGGSRSRSKTRSKSRSPENHRHKYRRHRRNDSSDKRISRGTRSRSRERSHSRDSHHRRSRHSHRHHRRSSRSRSRDRRRHSRDSRRRSYSHSPGHHDQAGWRAERWDHSSYHRQQEHDHQQGNNGEPYNSYGGSLAAGLDGVGEDEEMRRHQAHWMQPTKIIIARGIPTDKEEAALLQSLSAWPGLVSARTSKDAATGLSKGVAHLVFDSVESAQRLMDDHVDKAIEIDGAPLSMQGINFLRRTQCYQCSTDRPANPQKVTDASDAPSPILRASGLEPSTSEQQLTDLFSRYGALREVRMIQDKFTGAPRGIAFVQFNTVDDATKVLKLLQNTTAEGQSTPLRLVYAKDRQSERVLEPPPPSGPAADALQAAQAMQNYSTWQPLEYEEAAAQNTDQSQGDHAQQQARPQSQEGAEAAGAAEAGFVYDSNSGYYYDASSGYYYDANSGLYYHQDTQSWYSQDATTGEMTPAAAGTSSAAEATIAATNSAVAEVQALASLTAPEISHDPTTTPAPMAKKRGAIIGSAPQLNAQGLMAAAELAKEKEAARLKQEAAAVRRAKAAAATPGSSSTLQGRPT